MARKIFIAGNWKMNKTAAETKELCEALKAKFASFCPCKAEVAVCPPFTSIAACVEALKGSNIKVGAQNIHWADNGAFTGEISGAMLKEAGVSYVIIGHSERRQYFGETDETVNQRTKAALANGLKAVICVGENLTEREKGVTLAVIEKQVRWALDGLTADQMKDIVIAYEPVWAIGTGKTATPDMAQEVHAQIRAILADLYGADAAETVRILYGGSMKPANAPELLAKKDIDGGLIGGASLKAPDFLALVAAGANA